MQQFYSLLKSKTLPHVPLHILQAIKKIYYPIILSSLLVNAEPDLEVVQCLINEGNYVIDIGSNFGVYTKALSELVGAHGLVYSIEPVKETYELLCSNIRKLKLHNVEAVNCAISDLNGNVRMVIPQYPQGGENYYQARVLAVPTLESKERRFAVRSSTIDSMFLNDCSKISFIKCDVEGHELRCLQGAKNFLLRSRAAWLMEVAGDPDNPTSAAHNVFEIFAENDYTAWWFNGKTLNKRLPGQKSINYFFLQDAHLAALKTRKHDLIA